MTNKANSEQQNDKQSNNDTDNGQDILSSLNQGELDNFIEQLFPQLESNHDSSTYGAQSVYWQQSYSSSSDSSFEKIQQLVGDKAPVTAATTDNNNQRSEANERSPGSSSNSFNHQANRITKRTKRHQKNNSSYAGVAAYIEHILNSPDATLPSDKLDLTDNPKPEHSNSSDSNNNSCINFL